MLRRRGRHLRRNLVVLGASGQARETAEVARINGLTVIAFLDVKAGPPIGDVPVFSQDSHQVSAGVRALGVGDPLLRRRLQLDANKDAGYGGIEWPRLCHPSAVVSSGALLREGVFVQANSVVSVDVVLESFALVNYNVTVGHGARVGPFSVLLPGAAISGDVRLGECVTVGSGAVILPGVSVGDRSIIGAGSVVVGDVPADTTIIGVPGRIRGSGDRDG